MSKYDDLGDLSFDMDFGGDSSKPDNSAKKKPDQDFDDFGDFNFGDD